jgi:putative transposase
LERALQWIKGGYSHRFGAEYGRMKEVWQRGFTDHRIRISQDFEAHRQYIQIGRLALSGLKPPEPR